MKRGGGPKGSSGRGKVFENISEARKYYKTHTEELNKLLAAWEPQSEEGVLYKDDLEKVVLRLSRSAEGAERDSSAAIREGLA